MEYKYRLLFKRIGFCEISTIERGTNMSTFNKKSADKNKWMIDPGDAVMLLIDHRIFKRMGMKPN